MRTLLKILLAVVVVLVVLVVGVYAWATIASNRELRQTVETHRVDFPIPFPLDAAESASLDPERGRQPAARAGTRRGARTPSRDGALRVRRVPRQQFRGRCHGGRVPARQLARTEPHHGSGQQDSAGRPGRLGPHRPSRCAARRPPGRHAVHRLRPDVGSGIVRHHRLHPFVSPGRQHSSCPAFRTSRQGARRHRTAQAVGARRSRSTTKLIA